MSEFISCLKCVQGSLVTSLRKEGNSWYVHSVNSSNDLIFGTTKIHG